jgi:hypothetical protein
MQPQSQPTYCIHAGLLILYIQSTTYSLQTCLHFCARKRILLSKYLCSYMRIQYVFRNCISARENGHSLQYLCTYMRIQYKFTMNFGTARTMYIVRSIFQRLKKQVKSIKTRRGGLLFGNCRLLQSYSHSLTFIAHLSTRG